MARIAVVEDEMSLRADVVEYLSACGHQVTGCEAAPALDRALAEAPVDIVILDINLPGEDGFSIAKRLRDASEIGIIMLTARNVNIDRVVGLEVGADVYLTKPVELRELEAQIRTLARRLKVAGNGPAPSPAAILPSPAPDVSCWSFDRVGWDLIAPEGQRIKLTGNERTFIALLVERPGSPVSRADIFKALGKREWDPTDRSVDSMVRRLRAKAETALGQPLPVDAVHGTGYAFTAPVTVR